MSAERRPFTLSDQVKGYLKIFAPRPELRKQDTAVGNLVLKAVHGKGRFPQDRITEINSVMDFMCQGLVTNESTPESYCIECYMQLPTGFRSEIHVALLDGDLKPIAVAKNLADLGITELVNTVNLLPVPCDSPNYLFEFYTDSFVNSQSSWTGNTIHVRSPVPFAAIELQYWGYGKKYDTYNCNNVTSISWIDLNYPEYVALEIAKLELIQAGYQQEAGNLEAMRREAEHAFLVDQAAQEGGAYNG